MGFLTPEELEQLRGGAVGAAPGLLSNDELLSFASPSVKIPGLEPPEAPAPQPSLIRRHEEIPLDANEQQIRAQFGPSAGFDPVTMAKSAAGFIPSTIARLQPTGQTEDGERLDFPTMVGRALRPDVDPEELDQMITAATRDITDVSPDSPITLSEEEERENPGSVFVGQIVGGLPLATIGPASQVGSLATTAIGRMAIRGVANAAEQAPLNALEAFSQDDPKTFVTLTAAAAIGGAALEGLGAGFRGLQSEFQSNVSREAFGDGGDALQRTFKAVDDLEEGVATEDTARFLAAAERIAGELEESSPQRADLGADGAQAPLRPPELAQPDPVSPIGGVHPPIADDAPLSPGRAGQSPEESLGGPVRDVEGVPQAVGVPEAPTPQPALPAQRAAPSGEGLLGNRAPAGPAEAPRGATEVELPGGFRGRQSPRTGTIGLKGPSGEKIGVKETDTEIEFQSIGKGDAPDSRAAQEALIELSEQKGKPVVFTSPNLSADGSRFRDGLIRRGQLVEEDGRLVLRRVETEPEARPRQEVTPERIAEAERGFEAARRQETEAPGVEGPASRGDTEASGGGTLRRASDEGAPEGRLRGIDTSELSAVRQKHVEDTIRQTGMTAGEIVEAFPDIRDIEAFRLVAERGTVRGRPTSKRADLGEAPRGETPAQAQARVREAEQAKLGALKVGDVVELNDGTRGRITAEATPSSGPLFESRSGSVFQLEPHKVDRVIPEGVETRDVEVVQRPKAGSTPTERSRDQASTMKNVLASVQEARKAHLGSDGRVKEDSPSTVEFRVGKSNFRVFTEALPTFEKRLRALTKPEAFKFKNKVPAPKGPGSVRINDILDREVIPLPKFRKRFEKAEQDFLEAVRGIPGANGVRSIGELQAHIKTLDPKDFDKASKQLNELFRTIGEKFDEVAKSRGRGRMDLDGKSYTRAADVPGDSAEARTLRQWLTKKEEYITSRVNAMLAGDPVGPVDDSFPVGILRPGERGESPIPLDIAASAIRGAKATRKAVRWVAQNYMRPYEKALEVMGPQGRSLANRVRNARDFFERRAGFAVANYLDATERLNDRQFDQMIRFLEGETVNVDRATERAAGLVRIELEKVRETADSFGWNIGDIADYFPHRFKDGPRPEQAALPVAEQLSERSGRSFLAENRARTYNLERAREKDLKGYRRDRDVVSEYLIDSYKQLSEIAFYGQQRGNRDSIKFNSRNQHIEAYNIIGRITDPVDQAVALQGFRRLTMNETERSFDPALRRLRDINAFISLSTSAIPQTSQVAHIFSDTSLSAVQRAAREVVGDNAAMRREALRSGAMIPVLRGEMRRAAGGKSTGFMWGLPTMDAQMRVTAVASARHHVANLVKAGDVKGLVALGVPRSRALAPTEADILRVGRKLSDTTQFRSDTQDIPVGFTSEGGKTVFQFQSFMFRHTAYIADMVRNAPRNPGRLAKFLISAAVLGEMAQDLRAIFLDYDIIGEHEEFSDATIAQALSRAASGRRVSPFKKDGTVSASGTFWRAIQNFAYVGGIGIWQSLFENWNRPGPKLINLGGPTVGRSHDLIQNVIEPSANVVRETVGGTDEEQEKAIERLGRRAPGSLARQVPSVVRRNVQRFIEEEEALRRERRERDSRRRRERRERR